MTEQEYDEQIAPMLAKVAEKVSAMGGSMVARVEWAKDEAGITHIGITEKSVVGQQLTDLAALCRGNFDLLCIEAGNASTYRKPYTKRSSTACPTNPWTPVWELMRQQAKPTNGTHRHISSKPCKRGLI